MLSECQELALNIFAQQDSESPPPTTTIFAHTLLHFKRQMKNQQNEWATCSISHIIWFSLIAKMAIGLLSGKEVEDSRSSEEELDSDSEKKES